MNFIKQIKQEIKLIISTKFLMILACLLLILSLINPFWNDILTRVIFGKQFYENEVITMVVDGVTITNENPMYNRIEDVNYLTKELEINSKIYTTDENVRKKIFELLDEYKAFYVKTSQTVTDYLDYRIELAELYPIFVGTQRLLQASESERRILRSALEVVNPFFYMGDAEFNAEYVNITTAQRAELIARNAKRIQDSELIFSNKDTPESFELFIDLLLDRETEKITSTQKLIEELNREIIQHPASEPVNSEIITSYENEIQMIESRKEILMYRREKKINESDPSDWRNNALSDIQYNRSRIMFEGEILNEEEFRKQRHLVDRYETYLNYTQSIRDLVNSFTNNISIAQHSLDADMPDMKYNQNGARALVHTFVIEGNIVYLFAVLLGGWAIASEHQSGTIRLLLIRPKTRTKILISKYLSALIFCFFIYLVSIILCMIMSGIKTGFGDYLYPIYSVSGQSNFFIILVGRIIVCFLPILFMLTFSFMLSVIMKNIALSLILPYGLNVLSSPLLLGRSTNSIFAFTPLKYFSFAEAFSMNSNIIVVDYVTSSMFGDYANRVPMNVGLGACVLLVYTAISLLISIWLFNKQDIQN